MKKVRLSAELRLWVEARRRHRLSHAQVQMARELGMTPKSLDKLEDRQPGSWKPPLPAFLEERCFRRFGKQEPENVLSLEELAERQARKKAARREAKLARKASSGEGAGGEGEAPTAKGGRLPD